MENDFFNSYKTAEWQRKKNAVLERDNYTCQICGNRSGLMQVHHITYNNCRGKAYNSPMGDLITLCEHCHAHDDGDHKHFYNGEFVVRVGKGKPYVDNIGFFIAKREAIDNWWEGWMNGIIISAKHKYLNWRCVGFFTSIDSKGKNAWFPFLQGLEGEDNIYIQADHDIEDFSDIRLADSEEANKFISLVEAAFPRFEETVEVSRIHWEDGDEIIFSVNVPLFETRYLDFVHETNTTPKVQQTQPSEIILRSRNDPSTMVKITNTKPPRIMVNVPKSN